MYPFFCQVLGKADKSFSSTTVNPLYMKDSSLVWRPLPLQNSVDSDKMQNYGAFHLVLHCLQKNFFRGSPAYKG